MHPGKDARKALAQVRALGWSFREEGHFGRIRCPHAHHNGGCELAIWGTSKDKSGSATARMIQQKLRACARVGGDDPDSVAEAIVVALPKIERLVESAERLRDSDRLRREAQEALDNPDPGQTDDDVLARAERLERESEEAQVEALIAAAESQAHDPWPPRERARSLAATASARLEELLQTIDLSSLDRLLVEQIHDLRSRLETFD